MPLTFKPADIPTESESTMLANLPPAGDLYYFFNTDKNGNVFSIDSAGNIVFVANKADCCTCCLADKWMKGLVEALESGSITGTEYNTAIAEGFYATSSNDGAGNCTLSVGTNFARLTAIAIAPRPTTLAIGANVQLAVVPTPANADARVLWISSNTDKATVSPTGLVHGVGAATVTIHAYSLVDGTITDSISIVVS